MGVRFSYNTSIEGLRTEGGRIAGVDTSVGFLAADHCVLALGSYSRALRSPFRIDVPVYPLKGYSLTVPIQNPDSAPVSTVSRSIGAPTASSAAYASDLASKAPTAPALPDHRRPEPSSLAVPRRMPA